jgi:hypothetical protein
MLDTGNAQFEEAMTNAGSAVGAAPLTFPVQLMVASINFQAHLAEAMIRQPMTFWFGLYTGAFVPRR